MELPDNISELNTDEKIRIISNWGYKLSCVFDIDGDGDGRVVAVGDIQGPGVYFEFTHNCLYSFMDVDSQVNKSLGLVYWYILTVVVPKCCVV